MLLLFLYLKNPLDISDLNQSNKLKSLKSMIALTIPIFFDIEIGGMLLLKIVFSQKSERSLKIPRYRKVEI